MPNDADNMAASSAATTQQVFDHHLRAFALGIDALLADYTEASVIELADCSVRGLDGIRRFFEGFLASTPAGFWEAFRISRQAVEGDIAYLVWDARHFVLMATDTLYVRDGKILVQTFTQLSAGEGGGS